MLLLHKTVYGNFRQRYTKVLGFYENYDDSNFYFCHTCAYYLKLNKLPSISILNDMYPGEIPQELAALNDVEISLISQIRPYMKIISLSRSHFGQKGLKGNVIHFAQCVEEVIEQLPLRGKDSDCIVVTESLAGINRLKELQVRPWKIC